MRLIVDRLNEIAPVHSVRATGGVFRSALWREVMAAMLARPLQVIGEEEGTALGAAALGLFALGRAQGLRDAVSLLRDPDAPAPPQVDADPQLVKTYDRVRAEIPRQIRELDRVADLFAPADASTETN